MKHKKSVEISPFQLTGEKNAFSLANVGLQKYNEREKKMNIDEQILVNDSESEQGDHREERKKEKNVKIRKQKTAI